MMSRHKSSIYPCAHAPGSKILLRIPDGEVTASDRLMVMMSSLTVVGSVVWAPLLYSWALKRWKSIPHVEKRRRTVYATILFSLTAFFAVGPHRSRRLGALLRFKKWNVWTAWLKFVAFEVISDNPGSLEALDIKNDQVIFAISPHGIFPFALGLAVLPELASRVFGHFRPVVATATALFPILRTILSWLDAM